MRTLAGFGFITGTALISSAAFAVDIDINLGGSPRPGRTVMVQPSPVIERIWVPDRVVTRTERVLVEPARTERRAEKVLVQAAQVVRREERVLIRPARIEHVNETVQVQPARVGREWVPALTDRIKVGPVHVTRTIREGYFREFPIEAEYREVHRDIEIPAKYENVVREIEVPARYETVYRDVQFPAQYRDIERREVIPGHYQERIITGPSHVIVEPPRRGGSLIDIDIDLDKKKRRDRDR